MSDREWKVFFGVLAVQAFAYITPLEWWRDAGLILCAFVWAKTWGSE